LDTIQDSRRTAGGKWERERLCGCEKTRRGREKWIEERGVAEAGLC
jgi:hypothetical protein